MSCTEGRPDPILETIQAVVQGMNHRRPGNRQWSWYPGPAWIAVESAQTIIPLQGWKLHISADRGSAMDVLHRCLPVLLADTAEFKVAGSLEMLEQLNSGQHGPSQVGKFMTVYPQDDAHAVGLAMALHLATEGLTGPAVPSDRPLGPGSLVHYRFGAFQFTWTPPGEWVAMLRDPHGMMIPETKGATYNSPYWVVDPFQCLKLPSEPRRWVADPFQNVRLTSERPTQVYAAPKLEPPPHPPLERAIRPLEANERAWIERRMAEQRGPGVGNLLICLLLLPPLGAVLALAVVTGFGQVVPPGSVLWPTVIVGALAGLMVGVNELYLNWLEPGRELRKLLSQDLRGESVEMLDCTVQKVVEISLRRRKQSYYFLGVGETQVLFLDGGCLDNVQDLFPTDTAAETAAAGEGPECSPFCRIRVEKLPYSGAVLRVSRLDGQVQPRTAADFERNWSRPWELFQHLRHGELLPGSVVTLGEDLLRIRREREAKFSRRRRRHW